MILRGCIIHGKNVGLHGDKTSTGAQCIAARPGMSVMGLLKLYIGDKTTPCPKCGEVGIIVSGDHRHSNSAAVAVDGSEILCGCPFSDCPRHDTAAFSGKSWDDPGSRSGAGTTRAGG